MTGAPPLFDAVFEEKLLDGKLERHADAFAAI